MVDRLGPCLPGKDQREDLEWTISEIKKKCDEKVKNIESKQEEMCHEYFHENHKVTIPQVKQIYKYFKSIIDTDQAINFENSAEIINNIISSEYFEDEELIDYEENIPSHEDHIEHAEINAYPEYYQSETGYHDNSSYSGPNFRLDIDNFLKLVETEKLNMKDARENIICKVQKVLGEVADIQNHQIYGSYQTNLDLPWSDIDFVTFSPVSDGDECLSELNNRFVFYKETENWIKKIDFISTASVPIIKVMTEDSDYSIKVDITFGDETHKGSDCVSLVKDYMRQFGILSKMVMVIKQLLKVKDLNDPYKGGISSYALTLMIVAFLQFQVMYCGETCHQSFFVYKMRHDDLGTTIAQFLHFYSIYIDFSTYIIQPCFPGEYTHGPIIMVKFPLTVIIDSIMTFRTFENFV